MASIEPSAEQLQALLGVPDEGAIVMINLLRYREQAAYAADAGVEPCSGRDAYVRYSTEAFRHVASVGGRLVWIGQAQATVIAPEGEVWDDAALVQYPSRQAFLDMIAKPEYQACAFHRSAALADSRLILTRGQLLPES